MATYLNAVALAAEEVASITTGQSSSITGTDTVMLAGIASLDAGTAPAMNACRYNGSGGTSLTKIGTDELFFFNGGGSALYGIAPGPSADADSEVYGTWSGGFRSAVTGAFYSGVDQTTPTEGRTTASGVSEGSTTSSPSVTVTGTTSGQTVAGFLVYSVQNGSSSSVSAGTATNVRAQDAENVIGIAWADGVATGSSTTLAATITTGSATDISWRFIAVRVNDAAGGSEGPVGRSDETDTALQLARLQIRSAGTAAETSTAQTLAALQLRATGIATESDTAFALAALQIGAVGVAVEADTALQLARLQILPAGRADEADTAQALDATSGNTVGAANESDSAFALSGLQLRAAGLAIETDVALPLVPIQARSVGAATEADFALWLAAVQIAAVGRANETDLAYALDDGSAPVVVVRSAPPSSARLQAGSRTSRVQATSRTPRTQTRAR